MTPFEFIMAGATAVRVGAYNFTDPTTCVKIIDGLTEYCERHGVNLHIRATRYHIKI